MLPAKPPLPRPQKRPFQRPDSGSQTSIAMFDAGLGRALITMRQNAFATSNAGPAGGLNAPASCRSALTIAASSSVSVLSAEQSSAAACDVPLKRIDNASARPRRRAWEIR